MMVNNLKLQLKLLLIKNINPEFYPCKRYGWAVGLHARARPRLLRAYVEECQAYVIKVVDNL
jgi:hypothetical protein